MLQLVRALPYSHSEGKCVVLLSCDVVIFTYFLALKWQLASNSVVFMTRPSVVSFLMEDLLVPYVHYIPLQDDFSDLEDMVRWAKKNDKKARWIANQVHSAMGFYLRCSSYLNVFFRFTARRQPNTWKTYGCQKRPRRVTMKLQRNWASCTTLNSIEH